MSTPKQINSHDTDYSDIVNAKDIKTVNTLALAIGYPSKLEKNNNKWAKD